MVFERAPRKKYALKYADHFDLDLWLLRRFSNRCLRTKWIREVKLKKGLIFVVFIVFFAITVSYAENIEPARGPQISFIKKGFFEPVTFLKSAAIIQGTDRYYIGIKFLPEGYEIPGIGIWLVEGSKHKPSKAYAVNAVASLFSSFIAADQAPFAVSMADSRANKVLHFLKNN